jgi:hypothetical protein
MCEFITGLRVFDLTESRLKRLDPGAAMLHLWLPRRDYSMDATTKAMADAAWLSKAY